MPARHGRVNVADLAHVEAAFPPGHEKERGEDPDAARGQPHMPTHLAVSAEDRARARAIAAATPSATSPSAAAATSATTAPSAARAPVPPTLAQNFQALDDNNRSIPPDTSGAVGPNHLVVAHNSEVRIQNRSGGQLTRVSIDGFWNSLGAPSVFDPKVLYDPYQGRWLITACANADQGSSSVLIGASDSSDPTGSWNLYGIDADSANNVWADYPSLGFNKNWAVVQVNLFTIGGGAFSGSQIYAFSKADILAGIPTPRKTRFSLAARLGSGQVPATTLDPSLDTMHLIQAFTGDSGGTGFLRLMTITGAVGSETLNTSGPLVSGPAWGESEPGFNDFGRQQGTTTKISLGDDRIQDVVYRNGTLWAAHTIFLPVSSPTHSAIQWWQVRIDGSVQQRGRIENTSGPTFFAYPTITVNASDDALVGYSRFSPTQFASANYAFRAHGDPLNTLQADTVLKAGEASYVKKFSGTSNRFGDFSNTVIDPTNDNDFWTIQEYAATPRPESGTMFDRWGTWWGHLTPPTTGPIVSLSGATFTTPESTDATITLRRTNNPTGPVTVHYATSNGTATGGSDYTATAGTVSFADGVTSASFDIPITQDSLPEAEETVNIVLSAPTGAVLGSPAAGVLTIRDDDPVLQFSSAAYSVAESGPTALITVNRTGGSSLSVSASFATSDDTAVAGSDYTATSGTLTFGPGITVKTFPVPVTNDTAPENDESLSVSLVPQAPAALVPDSAPVTIKDNDPQIHLAASTITVGEAERVVSVTAIRTGAPSMSVSAAIKTVDGSATAGHDYTAISQPVTFAVGETTKTLPITILNDSLFEGTETFLVVLGSPSPGIITNPSSQTVRIVSNDSLRRRPDGRIKRYRDRLFAGNNVYNTTGVNQTRGASLPPGGSRTFYVSAQNDGNLAEVLRLLGSGSASGLTVTYSFGRTNITRAVRAGTYSTSRLRPGATRVIRIVITAAKTARVGTTRTINIFTRSRADSTKRDLVRVKVKVV